MSHAHGCGDLAELSEKRDAIGDCASTEKGAENAVCLVADAARGLVLDNWFHTGEAFSWWDS